MNAVLSVLSGFVIMRWRRDHSPSPLGRERLFSAMRVGLQFVRQSAPLRAVFLRVGLFFFHSTALLALLPLLARGLAGGGAGTFTLLLASMGLGAIAVAGLLPRLRQAFSGHGLVLGGTLLQSAATVVMALAPNVYVAVPAMFMGGAAWLTTANSLSVSAQMALPDWVRARGMSMYQMAIMGGSAMGAALWGQVAALSSLQTSLLVAAGTGALLMVLAQRFSPARVIEEDLTPSRVFKAPVAQAPPSGQIVVTIEYRIDPQRSAAFISLMQESRRSRLRQGALSWQLLHDIGEPGRYLEQIVDESWTEHLRRFDRITAADVALRERKLGFHLPAEQPLVSRYVLEQLA